MGFANKSLPCVKGGGTAIAVTEGLFSLDKSLRRSYNQSKLSGGKTMFNFAVYSYTAKPMSVPCYWHGAGPALSYPFLRG